MADPAGIDTDEVDIEIEKQKEPQSFWSNMLCCFRKAPEEEVHYDESPDRDFHADKIIKLTDGYTAYKLLEPKKSDNPHPPLIVLLHGTQNSSYMWADVAELLADFEQGPQAQVLVLDFYGHGRSPWDGRNLSLDCLVTQVRELMDALGLSDKAAALVGYDLGGAVAVGFAARYPHFCKSLTLVGPIGIVYRSGLNEKKLLPKYTGEFEMARYRKTIGLPENQEVDFFTTAPDAPHRYLIERQTSMVDWQVLNTPGYLGAILSLVRNFPMRDMDELFSAVGRNSRKVMIVWGVHDKVCPYRHCTRVMEECFPNALMVDVLDCGHNAVLEKFEEVVTEFLSFHREVFADKKSLAVDPDADD